MNIIDEYLEKLSVSDRTALQHIRDIVHKNASDVEEIFSWEMPTFKYRGRNLMHFAAFKNHLSIFPGPAAIEKFADELAGFQTSKGTVQFTIEKPLPDDLLAKIIKNRVEEIDEKTR